LRYIAFEGVEGAGKSTVVKVLAARLRAAGDEVVEVREPGGTRLGDAIRGLLLDGDRPMAPWAEAALFAAARAQLAVEVVRPALDRGAWVLSDRTVYSSLAYQGGARHLGVEEVRTLNSLALDGTWPDLVVWLDVDAEVGLKRQENGDRIGSEDLSFHQRVADTFAALAEVELDRLVRIDASADIETVVDLVWDLVT
jgi:dTMP kinase